MRLLKRLKLALITAAVSVGAPAALSINVSDSIGVVEDIAPQIQVYEASVDDDIGIVEDIAAAIPALEINVADTVGVTEDTPVAFDKYLVAVDDDIGLDDSVASQIPVYEVVVDDDVGVVEDTAVGVSYNIAVYDDVGTSDDATAVIGWLGVNSSHLHSDCGHTGLDVEGALDGTLYWYHVADETHYFVIDLGQAYNVEKVRGRSLSIGGLDPTDVNIYVSDNTSTWGAAVAAGISSWQGTATWQEEDVTDKNGRYVKVEIVDTEHVDRYLLFGGFTAPFKIFDVYVSSIVTLSISVADGIGVVDGITPQITPYEVYVSDNAGVVEGIITEPTLEIYAYDGVSVVDYGTIWHLVDVSDSTGVADVVNVDIPALEVNVYDSVGTDDYSLLQIQILEVSVDDDVGVVTATTPIFNFIFINVADTLGVVTSTTPNQAHGLITYDSIGLTDYSLLQIQILEVYTDDDIGIVDWRYHIIPGAEPTLTVDLFRFPRIPTGADDEMKQFLIDLESALRTALTGDSYVGGIINADGCKIGEVNNYIQIDKQGVLTLHGTASLP